MNQNNKLQNPESKLTIRNATPMDVSGICDLTRRVYQGSGMQGYPHGAVRGQINHFPQGQFVVLVDDKVVGYCATFRIGEKHALRQHSWVEITGNGYASRHNPKGDWLYGMEVCVDPEFRGLRIGQRLYDERKKLAQSWALKGIIYGGRLPMLSLRCKTRIPEPGRRPRPGRPG